MATKIKARRQLVYASAKVVDDGRRTRTSWRRWRSAMPPTSPRESRHGGRFGGYTGVIPGREYMRDATSPNLRRHEPGPALVIARNLIKDAAVRFLECIDQVQRGYNDPGGGAARGARPVRLTTPLGRVQPRAGDFVASVARSARKSTRGGTTPAAGSGGMALVSCVTGVGGDGRAVDVRAHRFWRDQFHAYRMWILSGRGRRRVRHACSGAAGRRRAAVPRSPRAARLGGAARCRFRLAAVPGRARARSRSRSRAAWRADDRLGVARHRAGVPAAARP